MDDQMGQVLATASEHPFWALGEWIEAKRRRWKRDCEPSRLTGTIPANPMENLSPSESEDTMAPSVRRATWEYEEEYGHVLYPENLDDVREKLRELGVKAKAENYPLLVEVFFDNDNIIAVIVGHAKSVFDIFDTSSPDPENPNHPNLVDGHVEESEEEFWLEHDYRGSHSVVPACLLLPTEKALAAFFQYAETGKLPAYIRLTMPEFVEKYVSKDH